MTTQQKTLITGALVTFLAVGAYEARQVSQLRDHAQRLRRRQAPLAGRIASLTRELDAASGKLAALRAENEKLSCNTPELLRLRGEAAGLATESRQLSREKTRNANDPSAAAAQAWVHRAALLKQRLEQWPKKTPEQQLLTEQDFLAKVANQELDTDASYRQAMSDLRTTAKWRFADAVNVALEQFAKANNGQLPSKPSQLSPYLNPPMDSFLDGWEISPPAARVESEGKVQTWSLVETGFFNPDGTTVRDGIHHADPEYDSYTIIYRGGYAGMGGPTK